MKGERLKFKKYGFSSESTIRHCAVVKNISERKIKFNEQFCSVKELFLCVEIHWRLLCTLERFSFGASHSLSTRLIVH